MSSIYGYRCDVCGEVYKYGDFKLLVERTKAVIDFPRFHWMHKESYDLCPSCGLKLKGMLESKEHTAARTCETCANWSREYICERYARKDGLADVWEPEDYCSRWEERNHER